MSAIASVNGASFPVSPAAAETVAVKTFWDHCVEYISSSAGMYDVSMAGKTAIDWLTKIPQLASHERSLGQTRSIFHVTSTVASVPYFISCATETAQKITNVVTVGCSPSSSTAKTASNVQKAAGEGFVSICRTVSAATDALGSFHEANWVDLGNAYPVVGGVFSVTNIVSEGADFYEAVAEVQENQTRRADGVSEEKKAKMEKENTLSFIKMVKNISSITGAVIGLISLGAVVVIGGVTVLPWAVLIASTVWITSTITAHFYKKTVLDAPLLS